MIWKRNRPDTAARRFVCVDGGAVEVLGEDDGWIQISLPDGTTPNVLATRTQPCTCGGKGCTR